MATKSRKLITAFALAALQGGVAFAQDEAKPEAVPPTKPSRTELREKQLDVSLEARDIERVLSKLKRASELAKTRITEAAKTAESASTSLDKGDSKAARTEAQQTAEMFKEIIKQLEALLAEETPQQVAAARNLANQLAKMERQFAQQFPGVMNPTQANGMGKVDPKSQVKLKGGQGSGAGTPKKKMDPQDGKGGGGKKKNEDGDNPDDPMKDGGGDAKDKTERKTGADGKGTPDKAEDKDGDGAGGKKKKEDGGNPDDPMKDGGGDGKDKTEKKTGADGKGTPDKAEDKDGDGAGGKKKKEDGGNPDDPMKDGGGDGKDKTEKKTGADGKGTSDKAEDKDGDGTGGKKDPKAEENSKDPKRGGGGESDKDDDQNDNRGTGSGGPRKDQPMTEEERREALARRAEQLAKTGETLKDILQAISQSNNPADKEAVAKLEAVLKETELLKAIEAMQQEADLIRSDKFDDARLASLDLADRLEITAQRLDAAYRAIVAPQAEELRKLEQALADLREKLDELETQGQIAAWHREAQDLLDQAEKLGISDKVREDLLEQMKKAGFGAGSERNRFNWGLINDRYAAPDGYAVHLIRVQEEIQARIQTLVLGDFSSEVDENTPPKYQDLVERYYQVLSKESGKPGSPRKPEARKSKPEMKPKAK